MSFYDGYEPLTSEEKNLLKPFVSNLEGHVFVLKNLPEVIKGALFSRYSRSYLGLRSLLLKEFLKKEDTGFSVEDSMDELSDEAIVKAQNFYDRILDGYGDDSIGELGGAHVAFENVSMLAAKHIEDARIGGSPLEKSTRYIYFDRKHEGKFLYEREKTIMNSRFAALYEKSCDKLFETYSSLIEPLTKSIEKSFPRSEQMQEAAYTAALRAKVLDCLRGLLPASTLTNMGVFGNGRFFEKLLTDLTLSGLSELEAIAKRSKEELSLVMASFVRRSFPENRHWIATKTYAQELSAILNETFQTTTLEDKEAKSRSPQVKLVQSDPEAVKKVLRALGFAKGNKSLEISSLQESALFEKLGAIRTNRRHKSPRALEHAFYTFEIEADFGAYRDLQRHRMCTQERQQLTCLIGYTIPKEIEEAGLFEVYEKALKEAKEVYDQIAQEFPLEAQYAVPMAYHIRWYYHINLRALQWMCELRSSPAGHSVYRYIAQEMAQLVKKIHPEFAPLLKFVDYDGYNLGRIEQETKRVQKGAQKGI